MAAIKKGQKYSVQVEYKPEYDETGLLGLPAYSQTFTKVSEDADVNALRAFADALMSLTIYARAPYKVRLVEQAELANI